MRISSTIRLLVLSAFAASFAVQAEEVIIEARRALAASDPQYSEASGNWQNSSVHTTAPGVTPGVGSRFNNTAGSSVTLRPNLQDSGVYLLEAAFPAPSSQSADIVVRIDLVGATLTNFSATTTLTNDGIADIIESTVFQRSGGSTNWRSIGTLVLDPGVSVPTVTFTHIRGELSSSAARFYSDAYRLVNTAEPCLSGLPSLNTVNGPLAAGQTTVLVPGVDTNATKVTVYANGLAIGQKVGGIVGGSEVETVTTTPLVAGEIITVTQHNTNDVESCRPNTGPIVGGGANPQVRISYSLRMDPALTGPIGAEATSASTWLTMLGATGPASGFGTAPLGGTVLQPSNCWQTVTYNFGSTDPRYTWAGTGTDPGQFALLDSLAFSMQAPRDSGPYAIYIDNIVNGSTLIEDFETEPASAASYIFNVPDSSITTVGNLLSQPPGSITPNVSVITNLNADTGTNAAFINWQFKDTAEGSWLRLVLAGTGTVGSAPQVDLTQPISIRFLVLPVGETEGDLQVTAIGRRTVPPGADVTLSVSIIKGEGPFTYQWRLDGVDLPFENASTLGFDNVQPEQQGNYSVVVTSPTCVTESFGRLIVADTVQPATLSSPQAQQGGTFAFTLTGSPQQNYLIQASSNLTTWSDVKTVTTDATGTIAVTDNPTESLRFYRAVSVPAP
jgi:hypothetical protein